MTSIATPTGHPELDEAICLDGYPRGLITEIFGPGPALRLALQGVLAAQQAGLKVVVVDLVPGVLLPLCAELGIDLQQLLVSEPHPDEACDVIEAFARTRAIDLIVVAHEDQIDPRRASIMLRRASSAALRSRVAMVCVDGQGRDTRSPTTAFRFYSSVRIHVRQVDQRTVARTVKNKLAAPFREVDVT